MNAIIECNYKYIYICIISGLVVQLIDNNLGGFRSYSIDDTRPTNS